METKVLIAGLTVALVHALLPNHWLPFVLIGRTQGWRRGKILGVVLLAGCGHAGMLAALGTVAAVAGRGIMRWLEPSVASAGTLLGVAVLLVFGLHYILADWRGSGHAHHHPTPDSPREDKAAILSLFLLLTFSPCEGLLPIFFAAHPLGLPQLLALALAIAVLTVGGMLLLCSLTLLGFERLHLAWLEQRERSVVGWVLVALAALVLLHPLLPV